jgi:hypothetical protein
MGGGQVGPVGISVCPLLSSGRMDGQTEDVELMGAKSRQPLHGSLQDILLRMEERDLTDR